MFILFQLTLTSVEMHQLIFHAPLYVFYLVNSSFFVKGYPFYSYFNNVK